MPNPRSFEEKRARILCLATEPRAQAAAELRRFLGDKSGYLTGDAAKVTAGLELREFAPDLATAFARLLCDPVKTDKGCFGKNRIAEALLALEADEPAVFLAGLRHVQREPAFGGPVDTATELRGMCAYALVRTGHPDALVEIAPLLVDPEPAARSAAANALGATGLDAAGALLHLKALAGDQEPDVLGACYRGLLGIAPGRYLDVVAGALRAEQPGAAEAAALALGESRRPEALAILKRALANGEGGDRESVLLGIALLRSDEGNAFLVSLVEEGSEGEASAALGALSLHRHDQTLVTRVRGVVAERGSTRVSAAFKERFEV